MSDYVTAESTGRGCRRCLSTLSFILHSYWLLSLLSCCLSARRQMPGGSTVQSKNWAALHRISIETSECFFLSLSTIIVNWLFSLSTTAESLDNRCGAYSNYLPSVSVHHVNFMCFLSCMIWGSGCGEHARLNVLLNQCDAVPSSLWVPVQECMATTDKFSPLDPGLSQVSNISFPQHVGSYLRKLPPQ